MGLDRDRRYRGVRRRAHRGGTAGSDRGKRARARVAALAGVAALAAMAGLASVPLRAVRSQTEPAAATVAAPTPELPDAPQRVTFDPRAPFEPGPASGPPGAADTQVTASFQARLCRVRETREPLPANVVLGTDPLEIGDLRVVVPEEGLAGTQVYLRVLGARPAATYLMAVVGAGGLGRIDVAAFATDAGGEFRGAPTPLPPAVALPQTRAQALQAPRALVVSREGQDQYVTCDGPGRLHPRD